VQNLFRALKKRLRLRLAEVQPNRRGLKAARIAGPQQASGLLVDRETGAMTFAGTSAETSRPTPERK